MAFKTNTRNTAATSLFLQDRPFDGLALEKVVLDLDAQISTSTGMDRTVGARNAGDTSGRSFRAVFVGERKEAFDRGLGAHIQALWEQRCNAAFAARDRSVPDASDPFVRITAAGVFRKGPQGRGFLVATWAWVDAQGARCMDGRFPGDSFTAAEGFQQHMEGKTA